MLYTDYGDKRNEYRLTIDIPNFILTKGLILGIQITLTIKMSIDSYRHT